VRLADSSIGTRVADVEVHFVYLNLRRRAIEAVIRTRQPVDDEPRRDESEGRRDRDARTEARAVEARQSLA